MSTEIPSCHTSAKLYAQREQTRPPKEGGRYEGNGNGNGNGNGRSSFQEMGWK